MKGAAPLMATARRAGASRDDWRTPPDVLRTVRSIAPIALDPCTTLENPVDARQWCWLPNYSGLETDWLGLMNSNPAGPGLVYVNPPYSQAAAWASKVVIEAKGVEIVTLTAARTDTRWFYELVWDSADCVCFQRGRLRFEGAPHPAPFPSAFVYHGPRPWAFEAAFHGRGKVVRLP